MIKKCICVILSICIMAITSSCINGGKGNDIPITLPFSNNDSSFSIQFLDVGQGDSALVCCDGHYVLIDGGNLENGSRVYNALKDESVDKLDYLIMSHIHEDHIGGLPKALTWGMLVDTTLAPVDYYDSDLFLAIKHEVKSITVPNDGEEYELGSATFKILENGAEQESDNDSIVLLITYKKTTFLFTGDTEHRIETKLCDMFHDELPVDLLKVAHHGSSTSTSIRFLNMLTDRSKKQYAIISVGSNNVYGHPNEQTLSRLDQAGWKYYMTKDSGDITVESDGKKLSIETSK